MSPSQFMMNAPVTLPEHWPMQAPVPLRGTVRGVRSTTLLAALVGLLALTATGAAAPAPPPCATAQLRVSVIRTGVAAGTVGGYLAFTNRLRSVCTLRGWPMLRALRPGASATAI